jgi:hypothetical protein
VDGSRSSSAGCGSGPMPLLLSLDRVSANVGWRSMPSPPGHAWFRAAAFEVSDCMQKLIVTAEGQPSWRLRPSKKMLILDLVPGQMSSNMSRSATQGRRAANIVTAMLHLFLTGNAPGNAESAVCTSHPASVVQLAGNASQISSTSCWPVASGSAQRSSAVGLFHLLLQRRCLRC